MPRVHANNYVTTLNGDISSGATSIIVTSASGFPTVGSGATANVTLANGVTIEIVTCTARSGTTLTVTRGAEGTTPAAFVSGSTVSIRPTADSVDRKRDLDSYTTTATAAGTTTLTVNSTIDQFFTGSTTQTVVLPVTSTLALGRPFRIVNESSGVVTVQSSGANTIQAMAANTILDLKCILTSGTGTASWYANYSAKTNPGTPGDVVGPGSSTDNAIARFDSTTGKIIQNSGVIIDDSNNITGAVSVAATSYLKAGGNATAAGYIELLEDSDNGSNKLTITAPASIASDRTATLPDATGTFTLLGNSSTGSGSVVLATSPTMVTPILGVAAATSINFGDEALDKYDEGSWTPAITFDTPGDLSVVYGTRTGTYVRIGKAVIVEFDITFTPTFTTASGTFYLTGLPFTSGNDRNSGAIKYITNKFTWPAGYTQLNCTSTNSTQIQINCLKSADDASAFATANLTSGQSHRIVSNLIYTV